MAALVDPAVTLEAWHGDGQPTLTTGELRLRPWTAEDIDTLVRAYDDPAIQRWHVQTVSPTEAVTWIDARRRRWEAGTVTERAPDGQGGIVPKVELTHTTSLTLAERTAVHDLLFDVFDDMTEDDVEHALGGLHATIWDGDALLAHGAVVQRRLLHGGRALRAGYVEGVAVRADRQRQGLGRAVMTTLGDVVRNAYEIGGLGATDEAVALYRSLGWRRWEGSAWALTPEGVVETPDDAAAIFVLPVDGVPIDVTRAITCDWREGDVW